MARSDDEAVGSESSVPCAGSDTARRSVGSMTTTGFCARRTLSLVAAAALAVPVIGISAPAAEAASWVCAYTYNAGHTVGKACFKGNTAQVCDLRADGRGVYGTFGVRSVGVRTFKDTNGAASPCAYRTYSHAVVSASAYDRA